MNKSFDAAGQQPKPHGSGTPIIDLVKQDLDTRAKAGLSKYGELLMAHNGRDALLDAYQEAIDLAMYIRQELAEREALDDQDENKRRLQFLRGIAKYAKPVSGFHSGAWQITITPRPGETMPDDFFAAIDRAINTKCTHE